MKTLPTFQILNMCRWQSWGLRFGKPRQGVLHHHPCSGSGWGVIKMFPWSRDAFFPIDSGKIWLSNNSDKAESCCPSLLIISERGAWVAKCSPTSNRRRASSYCNTAQLSR